MSLAGAGRRASVAEKTEPIKVLMQGWLGKQWSDKKKAERRYCVVDKRGLHSFAKDAHCVVDAKGQLKLNEDGSTTSISEMTLVPHPDPSGAACPAERVQLKIGEQVLRTLWLNCADAAEAQRWRDACEVALGLRPGGGGRRASVAAASAAAAMRAAMGAFCNGLVAAWNSSLRAAGRA
jgi:hypothetical protein